MNRRWVRWLAVAGFLLILFVPVAAKSLRLRRYQHHLEETMTSVEAESARLRTQIERLKADPTYLERVARQRLRVAEPGEIVVRGVELKPGDASEGQRHP